ncbi:NAD(P)/FAD-dependent oxidoreductase [Natranaerobius trueperi]|uniref:Thioredoxin reductase n=1 Tax=Natranaerobius trueperi TaxID=759412 RepID=A0A226BY41_9FIRM|nr:NAD(P)/FAD-dependent oxidoreductase [Natranaerobius trueperi]OWZ83948.1 thioredoxin reductase [Natranaerobius trueperi]
MSKENSILDIAIIGCGPAGLSAALNAKARKKESIIFGNEVCSPKLQKAPHLHNYLGVVDIDGKEFQKRAERQVTDAGIKILRNKVDNIFQKENGFEIVIKDQTYTSKTVILATGVAQGHVLPGEEDLVGKGVSYCGTCDAPLFSNKTVAIIAEEKEGIQEAELLSDICKKVYYLKEHEGEVSLADNVEVIKEKPKAILGNNKVTHLQLINNRLECDGIFIVRDTVPASHLVQGLETEGSAIKVNRDMSTNIKGLYAAGDITGWPYQLGKAVGEGQIAALNAIDYISS